MRGERAQVTLFFIVGLVLIFTVAIIYLMLQSEDNQVAQATIDASTNPLLNSYLSSCVDSVAEDLLRSAGRRGSLPIGAGEVVEYPHTDVELGSDIEQIIYGITRNRDASMLTPYKHDAPRYPEWGLRLSNTALDIPGAETGDYTGVEMLSFQDGYFGDVHFPATCSRQGMNAPGTMNACRYYPGSPPGTSTGRSTQELMIESFTGRLKPCVDAGRFGDTLGREVEEVGVPVVNITFTQTGTIVHVDYPLRFAGEAQDTTVPFTRTYDVRYLPVAEFAYALAREETRNISFKIDESSHYERLPSWREGFLVLRTSSAASAATIPGSAPIEAYRSSELITIVDERSRIAGAPYRFNFLVEDRAPMMDWLTEQQARDFPGECPAKDPDDNPFSCSWDGPKVTVSTDNGEKDCLQFDGEGNPESEGYTC
jgi:hypothetical protein